MRDAVLDLVRDQTKLRTEESQERQVTNAYGTNYNEKTTMRDTRGNSFNNLLIDEGRSGS